MKDVQVKKVFILLSLFSFSLLQGQKNWLPEDPQSGLTRNISLCKPGVCNDSRSRGAELSYTINSGFDFYDASLSNDVASRSKVDFISSYKAKLKIPLLNKKNFKMLLGYEYNEQTYHFGQITSPHNTLFSDFDGKSLKSTRYTLYMSKPFNEKYYSVLRMRATFNGDYQGMASFENRYATYSGIAALGIKVNDNHEWGVGLSYSTGFRNTRLIPFLVYNRTFNQHWGIEAIVPLQIMGRYNYSPNTILLFGAEYTSNAYSVDLRQDMLADPSIFHIRHAAIDASVTLEQKICPWLWFEAKGGYRMPFSSDFENISIPEASFEASQNNSFFLKVGLFLSPPDKYMK